MGLLDRLTQGGSPYSITGNGQTPSTNVGATQQSKLHASGEEAGYSLNGNFTQEVNAAYVSYVDGMPNILPQPSQLDLNGGLPGYGEYRNNAPEGATF
jgi:hypothetical protein